MKQFFSEIKEIYDDPAILIAIGVCIAIAFFDLFIKQGQGFPYIIIYGDSNAGKSTLLYCLASIFGFNNRTELTSGTSTIAIFREQLSRLNNIPFFIEEVDKNRIERLEDLGKDCFSATPRKKCSKDGGEIVTEINTTFCATSNHFFENMTFANFSRSILVNIPLGKFDLSTFKYHDKSELEKLSSFLPLILAYRPEIIDRYSKQFEIAKRHCTYSRLCNNVAIGMTIWDIINEITGSLLVHTELLAIQYFEYFERYLETELKYGDLFLSEVYKLYTKKALEYGRDFVITKRQYLRINLKKYCDIYNSINDKKKINIAQLKLKLINDKRFNLKATDLKPIGKAIKVDISQEETVLDILRLVGEYKAKEFENE